MVLFQENGIRALQQYPIPVSFHGHVIGDYFADILVEDSIILELKSQIRIAEINKAQALHYLKATGFKLALLINFGRTRLEYERIVLSTLFIRAIRAHSWLILLLALFNLVEQNEVI